MNPGSYNELFVKVLSSIVQLPVPLMSKPYFWKAGLDDDGLLKALKLLFEIRAIVPSLLFPKFSSLSAAQSVYGLSASPFQPVTLAILPLFCLITNRNTGY